MPMILLTVPPDAVDQELERADTEIKAALRAEGVQGGITIWPVRLAMSTDRLLLEYKSRQEVRDPSGLAQVAAEAAKKVFNIQVEAAVMKMDPATTGLYITLKQKE